MNMVVYIRRVLHVRRAFFNLLVRSMHVSAAASGQLPAGAEAYHYQYQFSVAVTWF